MPKTGIEIADLTVTGQSSRKSDVHPTPGIALSGETAGGIR